MFKFQLLKECDKMYASKALQSNSDKYTSCMVRTNILFQWICKAWITIVPTVTMSGEKHTDFLHQCVYQLVFHLMQSTMQIKTSVTNITIWWIMETNPLPCTS